MYETQKSLKFGKSNIFLKDKLSYLISGLGVKRGVKARALTKEALLKPLLKRLRSLCQ